MKKIAVIMVILMGFMCLSNVFAFGSFSVDNVNNGASETSGGIQSANDAVTRIWGTVVLIMQILAVAAIVIAGVRYMFASADAKADIKKQTIGLVVGAILVFAATTIIDFIVNVTKEITDKDNVQGKIVSKLYTDANGNVIRESDYDNDGVNDWADTITRGIPDILNQSCKSLNGKIEQWKKDHPDDKAYN